MARYNDTVRERALAMMESDGVTKTSEEMKITKATLYKWRTAARKEKETNNFPDETPLPVQENSTPLIDDDTEKLIKQAYEKLANRPNSLEAENARLMIENQKLRAVVAIMENLMKQLLEI